MLYYRTTGGSGILRGHLARANSQWQHHLPHTEALAIFSGPQHYVSPAWYPSKQEHGKVVPTWNYVVVHARGTVSFKDDSQWLFENVRDLTDAQESANETFWKVGDAPAEFVENLLRAIVGVELSISSLEGTWKMSQNRPAADREGVVAGLETVDSGDAREIAKLITARDAEARGQAPSEPSREDGR
jgi:transcriptional regulator